jgi:hypothetical protein
MYKMWASGICRLPPTVSHKCFKCVASDFVLFHCSPSATEQNVVSVLLFSKSYRMNHNSISAFLSVSGYFFFVSVFIITHHSSWPTDSTHFRLCEDRSLNVTAHTQETRFRL